MSREPNATSLPLEARALSPSELANLPRPYSPRQTKIERFGWKLLDEPGEFKLINKNELVIDEQYQRGLSQVKVNKLAREWSWIACGAISVSWREPLDRHLYYVMEGQHRTEAAKKRADIDALPCLVFKSLELSEEAAGFVNANSNRGALTMAARHKGSLMAGNRVSAVIDELAHSIGRAVRPASEPGSLNCVLAMIHAVETDEAALRRIFTLVGMICEGKPLPRNMLLGMFYIETHLPGNQSLASNRLATRLLERGYQRIMDSIATAMRLRGKGRPSTCAEGILAVLNYRVRNPVRLVAEDSDED